MVALPPDIAEVAAKAADGDIRALGRVLGIAGALIRAGQPVPDPLRVTVSERLGALAGALLTPKVGDLRSSLHEAVLPARGRHWRESGRKAGAQRRADLAAEAVRDLLEADKASSRKDRREALTLAAAALAGVGRDAVRKAVGKRAKARGESRELK